MPRRPFDRAEVQPHQRPRGPARWRRVYGIRRTTCGVATDPTANLHFLLRPGVGLGAVTTSLEHGARPAEEEVRNDQSDAQKCQPPAGERDRGGLRCVARLFATHVLAGYAGTRS